MTLLRWNNEEKSVKDAIYSRKGVTISILNAPNFTVSNFQSHSDLKHNIKIQPQ
jgi:hypothetical protein